MTWPREECRIERASRLLCFATNLSGKVISIGAQEIVMKFWTSENFSINFGTNTGIEIRFWSALVSCCPFQGLLNSEGPV